MTKATLPESILHQIIENSILTFGGTLKKEAKNGVTIKKRVRPEKGSSAYEQLFNEAEERLRMCADVSTQLETIRKDEFLQWPIYLLSEKEKYSEVTT